MQAYKSVVMARMARGRDVLKFIAYVDGARWDVPGVRIIGEILGSEEHNHIDYGEHQKEDEEHQKVPV